MYTKIDAWDCDGKVSMEYFCEELGCSDECIGYAITKLMQDYPKHFIYVGITHNPCYRFTGFPSSGGPVKEHGFEIQMSIADGVLTEGMLNERAHHYDFEKLFVICNCLKEADIRNKECVGIIFAQQSDLSKEKRVCNSTKGGNGRLKEGQKQYFLYVCISKTKPTFGYP